MAVFQIVCACSIRHVRNLCGATGAKNDRGSKREKSGTGGGAKRRKVLSNPFINIHESVWSGRYLINV